MLESIRQVGLSQIVLSGRISGIVLTRRRGEIGPRDRQSPLLQDRPRERDLKTHGDWGVRIEAVRLSIHGCINPQLRHVRTEDGRVPAGGTLASVGQGCLEAGLIG